MNSLTPEERERYSRQIILPEIGVSGQQKLKSGRVLVVGAGGLGSPVLLYLAAAGIGEIGVIDADSVDATNLQRQVIHGTPDLGLAKVDSAHEVMKRVNPNVKVRTFGFRFDESNAAAILSDYDIAVGCVDNFDARYILDAECVMQGKVHVYGAIDGFEGQASIFGGEGPCYRCFFREGPGAGWNSEGVRGGVLGSVAGVIGCIQANEVIKYLLGVGGGLLGRLLLFDGLSMRFREVLVKRDPDCPVCGRDRQIN